MVSPRTHSKGTIIILLHSKVFVQNPRRGHYKEPFYIPRVSFTTHQWALPRTVSSTILSRGTTRKFLVVPLERIRDETTKGSC